MHIKYILRSDIQHMLLPSAFTGIFYFTKILHTSLFCFVSLRWSHAAHELDYFPTLASAVLGFQVWAATTGLIILFNAMLTSHHQENPVG